MTVLPDVQIDPAILVQIGRRVLFTECVGAKDAAKLYSIDRKVDAEAAKKAYREGRLIAAKGTGGELRFPVWQFARDGGAVPGLRDVLAELRESPAWGEMLPFTFFLSHSPVLEGKRVIDELKNGNLEGVLRAARAARY